MAGASQPLICADLGLRAALDTPLLTGGPHAGGWFWVGPAPFTWVPRALWQLWVHRAPGRSADGSPPATCECSQRPPPPPPPAPAWPSYWISLWTRPWALAWERCPSARCPHTAETSPPRGSLGLCGQPEITWPENGSDPGPRPALASPTRTAPLCFPRAAPSAQVRPPPELRPLCPLGPRCPDLAESCHRTVPSLKCR